MFVHRLIIVLTFLSLAQVASAQSRLTGDEFTVSGGNFPDNFGITVDPQTQEATDHGSAPAPAIFNGVSQVVGGMNLTPTVAAWPGQPGGITTVGLGGEDVPLLVWENEGEVLEFSFETVNGGYIAQVDEFGQNFVTIRGVEWANSLPGSTPTLYNPGGIFLYWTNDGTPLTGMETTVDFFGIAAHPTDPSVPEVVYIAFGDGDFVEILDIFEGGFDLKLGTTQLDEEMGSWDLLGQVVGLPIFGEVNGIPADGLHFGMLVTPPEPVAQQQLCGDFDMDGDVDTADRNIQITNWTGALTAGDPNATKTFPQGDCDGDGDVDTADQNGTILNWTGALNAGNLVDGDAADLVYNPATGNVTLDATDTNSGLFISFVLGTDQNNMRTENFASGEGLAGMTVGPFVDVGTNTDNTPFQIGQTDPLNQGAGPEVNLGDIFPAGMDLAGLAEYLTLADYASELGAGGTFDLRLVPEPSSLALVLIGMLGLLSRRRHK